MFGGLGSDTLIAGSGDDFLSGDPVLEADAEQSADVLMAGAGDDTLNAGPGDTVTGGAGSDLFYISVELGVDNIEDAAVITDFEVGRDDIGNLFILQDLSAFSIAPGTGNMRVTASLRSRNPGNLLPLFGALQLKVLMALK